MIHSPFFVVYSLFISYGECIIFVLSFHLKTYMSLKVIQDQEIYRVGGTNVVPIDVRIRTISCCFSSVIVIFSYI